MLADLAQHHGTPLWVYDADTIAAQVATLRGFDGIRYAQKANGNVHILRFMRSLGVMLDAVSVGELERGIAAGYASGCDAQGLSPIVYTADVLDRAGLERVGQTGVPVNCGSIDMIDQLAARCPAHPVWLRINPGFGHGHSQKTNTGGEHSKHGIWHADLALALQRVRAGNLQLVGLHMHIGSGVDYGHLQRVCGAMVALAQQVRDAGLVLNAISAGGGLSVPYRAGEPSIDTAHYFSLWGAARQQVSALFGGRPIHLEIEPGRYLVAQSGVLLAEVRAAKSMGQKSFVLVDAGFNDLMRPALYGAYHGMSLLRPDGTAVTGPVVETVVAGPLCESGDVFTQGPGGEVLTRVLPRPQVGDLLVLHDAGAYGAAMSSNYNSRGLAAEVLVQAGQARLIRRRQTIHDLLALEETA
ncbi:MAG: diaminopimelate decarboxylase [Rhodoferax sp.]